jgi:hypothetical protein
MTVLRQPKRQAPRSSRDSRESLTLTVQTAAS